MRRLIVLIAATAFAGATIGVQPLATAYAQDMSKPTSEERAITRAAKKAKRVECGRQADAQNLHLWKRYRFVRKCLKSA